ncbi:enoyl-CoA hydratase/isomerase family protein [Roseomonas sp. ROY-5-3]|uniref:Enoyl-CoA hydratase/isomerase family protein n=2 Tax=Acetobacterales TaxID=3120395 RepID=A0ABS6HEH0_9PROT|nr:enoyl-CoA hydratase/isomerase family protein [Roseomonas oleicola]
MTDAEADRSHDPLRREDRGPVCLLTLHRPDRLNAMDASLIAALGAALDAIELDPRLRCVVITGQGRAFSAGADIAGFQPHLQAGAATALARFLRPGQDLLRRVEAFPKPVIAAVNGLAFGGGCELVEATHLALAGRSAVFAKAEIDLGIIPTFGGTQRLPRHVGRKAGLELILTGRRFGAEEAWRLGLVNRVVADADLMEQALRLATELAAKPPAALAAALLAVHRGMDAGIDAGLAIEAAAFAPLVPTRDAAEGVAAFLEKRRPAFMGE